MHDDLGPACGFGRLLDRELALALRGPTPPLILARLATQDFDLVGDHEGRIKADTELSDQAHILARVTGQLTDKRSGAGAGDCAEVLYQLLAVHADAVIRHNQGAGRFVGSQDDPVICVTFGQCRFGQRGITQPVASVGCIRDQLAQEDLFLAVERVRDYLEEAADFRLEASRFLGHRCRRVVAGTRRGYVANTWSLQVHPRRRRPRTYRMPRRQRSTVYSTTEPSIAFVHVLANDAVALFGRRPSGGGLKHTRIGIDTPPQPRSPRRCAAPAEGSSGRERPRAWQA